MAVRIRMKMMGRKHRPFFRICAIDSRRPRDGRVIEELGTYDPLVPDADARACINQDRAAYWLSVGALPSQNVRVLFKKYGPGGTHLDANAQARARLALPKVVPPTPVPVHVPAEPAAAEAPGEAAPESAAEAHALTAQDAAPAE